MAAPSTGFCPTDDQNIEGLNARRPLLNGTSDRSTPLEIAPRRLVGRVV